jgi:hypothetical protein
MPDEAEENPVVLLAVDNPNNPREVPSQTASSGTLDQLALIFRQAPVSPFRTLVGDLRSVDASYAAASDMITRLAAQGFTLTYTGKNNIVYKYQLTTNTSPPPGNGTIRLNNAVPLSSSMMYISTTTDENINVTSTLAALTTQDQLLIQDANDASRTQRFAITSPPSTAGTYFNIPISAVFGDPNKLTGAVLLTIIKALP